LKKNPSRIRWSTPGQRARGGAKTELGKDAG
jgi:hypothetical protein